MIYQICLFFFLNLNWKLKKRFLHALFNGCKINLTKEILIISKNLLYYIFVPVFIYKFVYRNFVLIKFLEWIFVFVILHNKA